MARLFIAIGFALGAGLGIVGGFLPAGAPKDAAWFVSSIGLIAGCLLLSARHVNEGRDIAAAGFALIAVGEVVMQAGQGTIQPDRLAAFARGVGLYVPGLLLLAWSDRYPRWVRGASLLTAVPFAAHAVLYFVGKNPPEQGPAASIGYGLLTVTMIGWVLSLYMAQADAPSKTPAPSHTGAPKRAG
jgi:hypothetical protein